MDETRVIRLPQAVTFATAPAVLEATPAPVGPGRVEIDLAGCAEFDSSLIAVLLELRRRALAAGADCVVGGAPANLRKLAALYGVDGLLLDQSN